MPKTPRAKPAAPLPEITHIGQLTPDPRNARAHTPRGLGMLADGLQEVGAARSIVVDEAGVILAGNLTVEAAAQAGIRRVQVVDVDGETLVAVRRSNLSVAEKRRLALLDNRVGELSDWNAEVMASIVREDAAALEGLFAQDELGALLKGMAQPTGEDPGPQVDRADELRVKWGTETGQLWEIGRHRLLCGDCRDAKLVARAMGAARADIVLTDPPYGMGLNPDWSGAVGSPGSIGAKRQTRGKRHAAIIGDENPFDPAPIFATFGYCKEMFLWGADYYAELIPDRAAGSWIVWDKRKTSQADAIGSEFELCWSRARHKRRMLRHDWFGFLSSENGDEARERLGPVQKPTSLMRDILVQWSPARAVVADPYVGTGTTLIAAEQTGRICYAMDISPAYVAVTLERCAGLGLAPILAQES